MVVEPVVEAAHDVVAEVAEPVVEAAPEVAEPVAEAAPEVVAEVAEPVVEAAPEVVLEPVAAAAPEVVAEKLQEACPQAGEEEACATNATTGVALVAQPVVAQNGTHHDDEGLKRNLWAAAAMVADSASATPVSPASFLPPSNGTAQVAKPELSAPVATVTAVLAPPEPAAVLPAPAADPQMMPGFIASVHKAPDPMQWFVFGGTAAFLGVIWVAIWIIAGK